MLFKSMTRKLKGGSGKSVKVPGTPPSLKDLHKLTKDLKKMSGSIERILIPVNLDYVRMYSGLPIFVDWKHPPFKFNEIIEWKRRMNLTTSFFSTENFDQNIKSE